jgi:hypothetical protein
MFSSRFVSQSVCVIFVGCLTGVASVFDTRVDGSYVRVWTSQLTWVHSKVAPCITRYFYVSRVKATKLLSGFVTMAE